MNLLGQVRFLLEAKFSSSCSISMMWPASFLTEDPGDFHILGAHAPADSPRPKTSLFHTLCFLLFYTLEVSGSWLDPKRK